MDALEKKKQELAIYKHEQAKIELYLEETK